MCNQRCLHSCADSQRSRATYPCRDEWGDQLIDSGLARKIAEMESPGRQDITSDPQFLEFQVALSGKPGSQMGDAVIEAVPPDYKTALKISTKLIEQSRHFELLIGLVKAASGQLGFQGFARSLAVLHSVVDECWANSYPEADADDDEDPWWERLNVLRELTDGTSIRDALYRSELVGVRHIGSFSKRDFDIASGRLEAGAEEKERCKSNLIRGAFTECDADSLIAIDTAMTESIAFCDTLDKLLAEHLGPALISCKSLVDLTTECQAEFREYAGSRLEAPAELPEDDGKETDPGFDAAATAPTESATVKAVVSVQSSVFANREAVAAAFTQLIRFYQQYEPSSPVPFLLHRARQMVYKNFFDILRELAPQHKDDFRQLVSTLKDDPLSFLLEHSFAAFANGESILAEHAEDGVVTDDESDAITSREQVLQTLLDIQRFFEQHEPSSPIPLIVLKVRNLVPKSFMDLLSEFEMVTSSDAADAAE